MDNRLIERCDLFVSNREIMKKSFKWDHGMMHYLCAILYTSKGLEINADKIKSCKQIIKEKTGFFSSFKDTAFLAIATTLSLTNDPKSVFDKCLKVYGRLKENGFHSSVYLTLSALMMAERLEEVEYEAVVQKAIMMYKAMKKEHPFLTSQEDYGFALILAMTDQSIDNAVKDMEYCYKKLKENFFSSNSVQSLSQVLAIGEEDGEHKCQKVMDIFQKLKECDCKYGTGSELSSLGVLALLPCDTNQMVSDIAELNSYLQNKKGFGFSIGRNQRVMYAAVLTAAEYVNEMQDDILTVAVSNSITSIIIASEMAMIAASSAAITAANSSSQ